MCCEKSDHGVALWQPVEYTMFGGRVSKSVCPVKVHVGDSVELKALSVFGVECVQRVDCVECADC